MTVSAPALQEVGNLELSGTDINATRPGDVGRVRTAIFGNESTALVVHGMVRVATNTEVLGVPSVTSMLTGTTIGSVTIPNLIEAGALTISAPLGSIDLVNISSVGNNLTVSSLPSNFVHSSYFAPPSSRAVSGIMVDIPFQGEVTARVPSIAHVSIQGLRNADALFVNAGTGVITRAMINNQIAKTASLSITSGIDVW